MVSRWFEWEASKKEDDFTLTLKQSEKVLYELEHIGQQLAVTFSHDGSLLGLGGEVGPIFHIPSLISIQFIVSDYMVLNYGVMVQYRMGS